MELTLLLTERILQFFLIGICGFALVKLHIFKYSDREFLSRLLLYLIMPCCLLSAFQSPLNAQVIRNLAFSAALSVGVMLFLMLLGYASKKVFNLHIVDEGSIIYTNVGYLNIPLVQYVFGNEYVIYATVFFVIQLFFMWLHFVPMMSGERGSFRSFFLNPVIPAALVSVVMLLTNIRLPGIINDVTTSLSGIVGPLSMIMIGISIANVKVKEIISDKRIYLTALLCLLVSPLILIALFLLFRVYAFSGEALGISVVCLLAAAAPPANIIVQFAVLYKHEPERASAINMITTILCIITIPLMTGLYLYAAG